MRSTRHAGILAVVLVLAFVRQAAGEPLEHPFVGPIPGFALAPGSEFEHYGAHSFRETTDEGVETREVRGPRRELLYENAAGERVYSRLEILENHRRAALDEDGLILALEDATIDFTVPLPDGGRAWAHVHAWRDYYELVVVDEAPFEPRLVFTARELEDALGTAGRIALEGVRFDFDAASLRPGSGAVLDEAVALLRDDPALSVEIAGHTDAVGSRDYNLDLSLRRARTVRRYLVDHGIEPERLTVAGYGFDVPVASNETADGRARNRRVELVRR